MYIVQKVNLDLEDLEVNQEFLWSIVNKFLNYIMQNMTLRKNMTLQMNAK